MGQDDSSLPALRIVDKSRKRHPLEVTEKPLLGIRELELLTALHKAGCPCTQLALSRETKYGVSAVSKSLQRLRFYGVVRSLRGWTKSYYVPHSRKCDVALIVGHYVTGKTLDVFDAHKMVYIADLGRTSKPKTLISQMKRRVRERGWVPSHDHHNYREWTKSVAQGVVRLRVSCRGQLTVTVELEVLVFEPIHAEWVARAKLEAISLWLRKEEGISVDELGLSFQYSYGEIPWLLDPFAVAAIKLGVQARYKEVQQSHFPEWEEYGTAEQLDCIYRLRQFCKNNGITEYRLAKLMESHPELLTELTTPPG